MKRLIAATTLVWLVALTAQAHQYFPGFADSAIEVQEGQLRYELSLGAPELAAVVPVDADHNNIISGEELDQTAPLAEDYIRKHLVVTVDGAPIAPRFLAHAVRPHDAMEVLTPKTNVPLNEKYYFWFEMSFPYSETGGPLEIRYTVFFEKNSNYSCPARIRHQGKEVAFVFSARQPVKRARLATWWDDANSFLQLGIAHILTGYDHLLFLFSLLVVSKRFKQVVIIVTAFTIAHSVTLSLAALGVLQIRPQITESAIALSIAAVAAENLRSKLLCPRWLTTFCFGFIHGFGFASALAEHGLRKATLAVSLASFNVGVEIGQIGFVLLLWPLIKVLSTHRARQKVVTAASTLVIIIALYWFLQRAFFPTLPDFPPQFR